MNPSNPGLQLKTDKRFRAWKIFFIAVIILPFGLAYLLACRPAFLASWNLVIFGFSKGKASCSDSVPVCTHTEGGTSLSNIVPLPHDVAQKAHRPMLDELRDLGKLPSQLAAQSDVHLFLRTTNREPTQRLACALKKHSCLVALEKELERLGRIDKVTREVGGSLEVLADPLIGKDAEITQYLARRLWQNYALNSVDMERRPKGSNLRESWPKWFWKHVA